MLDRNCTPLCSLLANNGTEEYTMDKPTHILFIIALVVGIVAGGMVIASKVRTDCWDFFGISKGCAVSVK